MSCAHAITNLDFSKGFTVEERIRITNRLCLKCYQHWYGPEGAVNEYTRAEWDAWINSVFEGDNIESVLALRGGTP